MLSRFLAFSFTLLALIPFMAKSQLNCKDFKTGIFYSYPKNTNNRSVTLVTDGLQTDIDLITGDTSVWQVEWKSDCSYILKYKSGGKTFAPAMIDFVKKHKVFVEIVTTTPDYYVYAGYIDKKTDFPTSRDTMWLHEKAIIPNNELFKVYPTADIPAKDHFSDTSSYAILYVYRPGKLTNSLSDFIVYFDDNPMWAARNNSGQMFKILKEGKYNITSRLLKDSATAALSIHFGKTYYIKSKVTWGLFKRLYNFKLEMEEPDATTGKIEFSEVKYR